MGSRYHSILDILAVAAISGLLGGCANSDTSFRATPGSGGAPLPAIASAAPTTQQSAPVTAEPTPATPAPVAPQTAIRGVSTGRCLDTASAVVVENTCSGAASQSFGLVATPDGFYQLQTSAGLCVDAAGGGLSPGGYHQLMQHACDPSAASQKWQPSRSPKGGYQVAAQDQGECIDVDGSHGYRDGIQSITYACDSGGDQAYEMSL